MELRPGYKQTEIGAIPDDWDAVPLAELFTFKNGLNKAKKFFGHGTPIVNYMDVFRYPGLRLQSVEGRVAVSKAELQSFEVRKGDVFFTRTSETIDEIGQAAAMLEEPSQTVFSGFVLRARPIAERLDDAFKAYCFSPRYFRDQVIARATYTTRALTNGRALAASKLAVPPAAEQIAIAEALADVDAAIAAMTKLLAKKRDLRTATMQRLLTGKERLAGFSGQWSLARLGDCLAAPPSYGINAPAVPFCDTLPKYIRITDITEEGDYLPQPPVSVKAHNARYSLKPGDIVFARTGATTGKSYLYDPRDGQLFYAGFLILARPDPAKLVSKFLAAYTTTGAYWNWVRTVSMRSGQPGINGQQFARLEVPLPPVDEQLAIAEVLTAADQEIALLKARITKTQSLKQAMMQALLTGRIRLPVETAKNEEKELAHA